jgi:hypothetical protein
MTLEHQTITPLPNDKPDAVPELWNSRYREIDENQQGHDAQIEAAKATIAEHGKRIGDIENQSASSVAQALQLDWLYRDLQIELELFYDSWTLLDPMTNVVTDAVAGDDSMDLDSVAGIVPGKEYVVFDDGNQESVIITEILSATRVRVATNMGHSYKNALLRRTSWTVADGKAIAVDGGIYLAGPINMGDEDADKTVVMRRGSNDGLISIYFKDATHAVWTRVYWSWEREIEPGIKDVEYCIPARGEFYIKTVSNRGESGVDTAIYHIACVDNATGLRGIHHPPEKPVNATPVDQAGNIQETPTLSVATYSHALEMLQGGLQVQMSNQDDFATILHDSGEQGPGLSYQVPAGALVQNGSYFWRMRVMDKMGGWSDWSAPTSFTCASAFTYIETPANQGPGAGTTNIAEQPTLSGSAFSVHGTTDTHEASQFRVRSSSGDWESPLYDSGESSDLTTHVIPAGKLEDGTKTYSFQVRYKGASLGWSDWSQETSFTTKDLFANIVGIAQVQTGGGAGTWQNVDGDGNNLTPSDSFFNNHPVYGGIRDVTVDGQAMVEIPKFYIKTDTIAGGDQAGKKGWFISDQPAAGFRVHPAFMDSGVEIDQFYYGKYEATTDSSKAGSKIGVKPLVSIDFPTMQARCNARNVGEVDGFHMVNIHELSAVQVLCLIENGGPDVQSSIGQGNVSSSAAVNTGASNANWRGIYELWGNTRCMIDGAQFDASNKIKVFDQNGNNSYVATGVTLGAATGWITGVHGDAGSGYDLGMMFLGKTTDGTENNGSFGDYQQAPDTSVNVCYHGGHWSLGSQAGLFYLNLGVDASYSGASVGSRLAKV